MYRLLSTYQLVRKVVVSIYSSLIYTYVPGCFVCTESEVVVNMLACMYRLLSTCWFVCTGCCQHVDLYVQVVDNMLTCMYRLLSTC